MAYENMICAHRHIHNIGEIDWHAGDAIAVCAPCHERTIIQNCQRGIVGGDDGLDVGKCAWNGYLPGAVVTPAYHRAICEEC
jgi:hypothetical protein